jgi:Icc-related predicted phosphoesterase
MPRHHSVGNNFDTGNANPGSSAVVINPERSVVELPGGFPMISVGYSNRTPWASPRELDEDDLATLIEDQVAHLDDPARAVFNLHPPPLGTQLDDAPRLDDNLQVQAALGQVQYAPVGSSAVREAELERQPLLGLHGHIHESSGIRRLGRTMIINPGSDYGTGTLNGVAANLLLAPSEVATFANSGTFVPTVVPV